MIQATPALRDLARLLLTLEANRSEIDQAQAGLSVFEKLRANLSKLVGLAGFHALLARALALAKEEARWLEALRVLDDATLQGFRETVRQQPTEAVVEGSAALLAQLLGLLITFIGQALTLRLIADVWPQAGLDEIHLGAEETPA